MYTAAINFVILNVMAMMKLTKMAIFDFLIIPQLQAYKLQGGLKKWTPNALQSTRKFVKYWPILKILSLL